VNTLPRGTNVITAIYSGDITYVGNTNMLEQIVTNHPPVAGVAFTMYVTLGTPSTMQIIGGKFPPTDADGDALIISNSGATNGTVTTDGTNITYTATNGTSDTITCTISDGYGGIVTGTINVVISSSGQQGYNLLNAQMVNGNEVLSYAGIPGYNYAFEWATNLTPPITWTPLVTNAAAGNGSLLFTNTPSGGSDYYRTRYVP
jgi:hypothetical protein